MLVGIEAESKIDTCNTRRPLFVTIYSTVCAGHILIALGGVANEHNIDDFRAAAACIAIIITS